MKPTLLQPALLLLILSTGAAGVPGQSAQAQSVRVAQVSGATALTHSGAVAALKPNDRVRPGDEIATDANSAALLRLSDGSTVEVYPSSRVVFQDASHTAWRNFLEVWFGTVKIHIEKLSGRPNPKSVTTPTAIIAVRGTIFDVRVDQEATTQVGVEEGLVSVAELGAPQAEVFVSPGFATTVQRGQSPAPPQQRDPDQSAPPSRFGPGGPGGPGGGPGNGPGNPGAGGPGQGPGQNPDGRPDRSSQQNQGPGPNQGPGQGGPSRAPQSNPPPAPNRRPD